MIGEHRIRPAPVGALVLLLVASAFQPAPASAIVYVMPTDESMVDRSPIIVFGEVTSAARAVDTRRPSTDFIFRVEEVLKGSISGGAIIVRQPGGIHEDGILAWRIPGLPMLSVGDRALLFLHESGTGVYATTELSLGMFWEIQAGGELLLMRESSTALELSLADEEDNEGARFRGPRHSAGFRRWISDLAAGIERPADYFATARVPAPSAVASPFRLFRAGPGCHQPDLPERWFEFDDGGSVRFLVQASGQAGVPGGGLKNVHAAARVWNNDPRSRVRLVISEAAAQPPSLKNFGDGVSPINFEDPWDDIAGSYTGEGGILAIGGVLTRCRAEDSGPMPGGGEAVRVLEGGVATQDGFSLWLQEKGRDPAKVFETVIAHELGHALGLQHSCGDDTDCSPGSAKDQALMRAGGPPDYWRGAVLGSDDKAGVRFLYPDPRNPPVFDGPDKLPEDVDPYSYCLPVRTALRLEGGYDVGVCYENSQGRIRHGRDWGLESESTGLLYFFDRDNVEILLKVLDGCAINGHRWVFVAPVTNLAFNLHVRDDKGRVWVHRNARGNAAQPWSDTRAFPCSDEATALRSLAAAVDSATTTGNSSGTIRRYQYDTHHREDRPGWFSTSNRDSWRAQRFRLRSAGRIRYVEACVWLGGQEPDRYRWMFGIHSHRRLTSVTLPTGGHGNSTGIPGVSLVGGPLQANGARVTTGYGCYRHQLASPVHVSSGDLWISFYQAAGDRGPLLKGGWSTNRTDVASRAREAGNPLARWSDWELESDENWTASYPLRIGVEHVDGVMTDCVPAAPSLELGAGFQVSMCYETPGGGIGDARDWGLDSRQSGLLFFFDRNNVETLIKVLDGCAINDHHWVFVAPVTTLGFNLSVSNSRGRVWMRRNPHGQTASSWIDTSAFKCEQGADAPATDEPPERFSPSPSMEGKT